MAWIGQNTLKIENTVSKNTVSKNIQVPHPKDVAMHCGDARA
jgi:hypothetical protein